MKLNVYLNFLGNTEEAFLFYRDIFGGDFLMLQRFIDVPDLPGKDMMSPEDLQKIMHIALPIGDNVLMGTDALESMGHTITQGNITSLSLHVDSKEEADRVFQALSAGGTIEMPIGDTFWNAYFGMTDDKYGVKWMISFEY